MDPAENRRYGPPRQAPFALTQGLLGLLLSIQDVSDKMQDPRPDLAEVAVKDRLDRPRGAHGHEHRSFHLPVGRHQPAQAGAPVTGEDRE